MNLLRYIGSSADTAMTLSAIAEAAGVSRREAEAAVQAARLAGEPIVSGPRGLWIGTDEEALAWCERARARAIHQLETVKGVQAGVEARRARQEGFPWAA